MSEYGQGFYGRGSARVDADWQNLIENQRAREERRAREEQLRRQQAWQAEQARIEAQRRYNEALMTHPSRQAYDIAQRSGVFDSGQLGEYQESPQEQAQRIAAEAAVRSMQENPDLYWNTPGAREDVFANIATGGHNPNESVAQAGIQGSTYRNRATLPAEQVAAQRVSDRLDLGAPDIEKSRQWGQEFGVRKTSAQIEDALRRAQTGEIGARARYIGEQTTTEIEGRDPNSPTTKAKHRVTGKSFTDKVADGITDKINKALELRNKLTDKLTNKDISVEASTLVSAQIDDINKEIEKQTARRELLQSGRAESYVPPVAAPAPRPSPREKIAARNKEAGHPVSPTRPIAPTRPAPSASIKPKPVEAAPKRYDDGTEAKIAKAMTTLGISREAAIAEAVRRGYIRE